MARFEVDKLTAFMVGFSFTPTFALSILLGYHQVWIIWGCTCGGCDCD